MTDNSKIIFTLILSMIAGLLGYFMVGWKGLTLGFAIPFALALILWAVKRSYEVEGGNCYK